MSSFREMSTAPARLDPGGWPSSHFPWRRARRLVAGAVVFALIAIGLFSFQRDDEQPEAQPSEREIVSLDPIVESPDGQLPRVAPPEEFEQISATLESPRTEANSLPQTAIPKPSPRPQR